MRLIPITAHMLREAFQQTQREILATDGDFEKRWERMAEILNEKLVCSKEQNDTEMTIGIYHIVYEDESAMVHIYGGNGDFRGDHEISLSLEEWYQLREFLNMIEVSVEY